MVDIPQDGVDLMPKLIIPNQLGHFEGSGFEVDISQHQIVVRTKDQGQQPKRYYEKDQTPQPPKRESGDDGNMSLMSSLEKLGKKFGRK